MATIIKAIAYFLADFSGLVCLFPFLLLIIGRRPLSGLRRILILILGAYFVFDALSIWISYHGGNNLFTTHLFTMIELPLWGIFFHRIFKAHSLFRKLTLCTAIAGTLFAIGNTLFLQPLTEFNTNARTMVAIIEICYCLGYLLMYSESVQLPAFRICAALLLYNGSSILLFVFSNYLLKQPITINYIIWSFHNLLLVGLFIAMLADGWRYSPSQG